MSYSLQIQEWIIIHSLISYIIVGIIELEIYGNKFWR